MLYFTPRVDKEKNGLKGQIDDLHMQLEHTSKKGVLF